jgi:predicted nucleotidyltransferase
MASLGAGLLGCYRCAHVWRPSRSVSPRICPRCKSRFWEVPVLRPVREGRGLGIARVFGPHRDAVLRAAERHGFRHVRVFGSVRRSERTAGSDVDLLVDRDPGSSGLDRAALSIELEELLGHPVDIVPEEGLHWLARPQVLFEAVPL